MLTPNADYQCLFSSCHDLICSLTEHVLTESCPECDGKIHLLSLQSFHLLAYSYPLNEMSFFKFHQFLHPVITITTPLMTAVLWCILSMQLPCHNILHLKCNENCVQNRKGSHPLHLFYYSQHNFYTRYKSLIIVTFSLTVKYWNISFFCLWACVF